MRHLDVTVVVLAHNHPAKTRRCLENLRVATDAEVILVDNASQPALINVFYENVSEPTLYQRNETNLAYARAHNEAMAWVTTPYVALLNNDCYLEPGAIDALRDVLLAHPEVAIVGAKLLYPDRKVQHCSHVFVGGFNAQHRWRGADENDPNVTWSGAVPAVTAALMIARRSVWNEIGGLDERYPYGGYEDTDFCLKAREKGHLVWYEASAIAMHEECGTYKQSGPALAQIRTWADQHNFARFRQKWLARYRDLNTLDGTAPVDERLMYDLRCQ